MKNQMDTEETVDFFHRYGGALLLLILGVTILSFSNDGGPGAAFAFWTGVLGVCAGLGYGFIAWYRQ